jgi:hypothetical protein
MSVDRKEQEHLKDKLGFENLADAKKKIAVLQQFYHETNEDIQVFEKENDLRFMVGYARNKKVLNVGFDYNLGRNVIWDPKEKLIYAIDF